MSTSWAPSPPPPPPPPSSHHHSLIEFTFCSHFDNMQIRARLCAKKLVYFAQTEDCTEKRMKKKQFQQIQVWFVQSRKWAAYYIWKKKNRSEPACQFARYVDRLVEWLINSCSVLESFPFDVNEDSEFNLHHTTFNLMVFGSAESQKLKT
ncbi:hypothetical protein BLOT_002966 [Blomia tropicalis]|nr:hypothetical protein BLOT_002966 [Blomia tropicalis]